MQRLGYIKEIRKGSVIFIVDVGEVEKDVDSITKDAIETVFEADYEALIPLDAEGGKVILDS